VGVVPGTDDANATEAVSCGSPSVSLMTMDVAPVCSEYSSLTIAVVGGDGRNDTVQVVIHHVVVVAVVAVVAVN
jgi:hypothetical protein